MAGALAYFVPRTEYSVSCIAKREPIVSIVFGFVAVGYRAGITVLTHGHPALRRSRSSSRCSS
jgi:hypothetical protein